MSFGRKTSLTPADAPLLATAAAAVEPVAVAIRASAEQFALVRSAALARLDPVAVANMDSLQLRSAIIEAVGAVAGDQRVQLNGREQTLLADELVHDMLGLGPLEPLLADDRVTDIMINGPGCAFIEVSGRLQKADIHFRDNAHLLAVAQRIASAIGRRVDESSHYSMPDYWMAAASTSSSHPSHWMARAFPSASSPRSASIWRGWSNSAPCRSNCLAHWK
jgi:pilus assembly protein CpaF